MVSNNRCNGNSRGLTPALDNQPYVLVDEKLRHQRIPTMANKQYAPAKDILITPHQQHYSDSPLANQDAVISPCAYLQWNESALSRARGSLGKEHCVVTKADMMSFGSRDYVEAIVAPLGYCFFSASH